MATSLKFYADSALADPLDANPLTLDREIGAGPVDAVVYLGSTETGRYFVPDTDPEITVSVTDDDTGAGFSTSDITLALSQAGLDTATAGAPLNLGGQIDSGAANAVPVFVRFSGTSGTPLSTTDLGLTGNIVREYAS